MSNQCTWDFFKIMKDLHPTKLVKELVQDGISLSDYAKHFQYIHYYYSFYMTDKNTELSLIALDVRS